MRFLLAVQRTEPSKGNGNGKKRRLIERHASGALSKEQRVYKRARGGKGLFTKSVLMKGKAPFSIERRASERE